MRLFISIFLLLASPLLWAQPNPALRNALRDHYIKNMYPVLKVQQEALAKTWSIDEAAFLAEKRAVFQQLKLKKRQLQSQIRQAKQSGKVQSEIKSTFATQRQQLQQERKQLFESMRPFVEKHQAKIVPINEKLHIQRQKWQQERQIIRQQYKARERKNQQDAKIREFNQIVRFLLWNGKNPYLRQ